MTENNSNPTLVVRDLRAWIGQSSILRGVDLVVPANSVTVLLGRNGVGKTSTLRAVLGLISRSGDIEFDGRRIGSMPTHRIANLGIGYVPEDRDVFHGLTVAENLRLAERPGTEPDYARVFELFPEMKSRGGQLAGSLSGGQQQMVSLSRALLNENKLLLIDEPTKGLAPRLVTEFAEALEAATANTAVLLVEQNLAVARRLADHVVVIDQGAVVAAGPAAEMFDDNAGIRQMLGVGDPTPSGKAGR
ncbi:ABC transporter ATP-binding protein [Gordonia sp. NPDC058843]|uniref:ABC transporter ATP-binding protein n=1 Tax=Gordonia sp. NPDC058843 TaxID=3346648 RepID=UPI0036C16952